MQHIAVVGDIHGRESWKDVIPHTEWAHRVVFIGDYMDSHVYTHAQCLENLRAILDYQQQHPSKVTLLLGNHDAAYVYPDNPRFRCAGFNRAIAPQAHQLFQAHAQLFRFFIEIEGVWLTHAGLVKMCVEDICQKYRLHSPAELSEFLSGFHAGAPCPQEFGYVGISRYGKDIYPGLLWADFDYDGPRYYPVSQIVGHTQQPHRPGKRPYGYKIAKGHPGISFIGTDTANPGYSRGPAFHRFIVESGKVIAVNE